MLKKILFVLLVAQIFLIYGMNEEEFEIISSDNVSFKLLKKEFASSKTLDNLFQDTQVPSPVPIHSKALTPLVTYLKSYAEGKDHPEEDLLEVLKNRSVEDDVTILGAANFLDIVTNNDKPLPDELCVWLVKEKNEQLFNYLKNSDLKKIVPITGLLKNTIKTWTIDYFKDIRHNKPIDQNQFKEFLSQQNLPWFIERFTSGNHQKGIICAFIITKAPQNLDKKKLEALCGDDSYYYDEFKPEMWNNKAAHELIQYLEAFSYLGNPQTAQSSGFLGNETPKLMTVNIKTELIKLLAEKITIAEYEQQKNKFNNIRAGEFDRWSLTEELEDILRKQTFEFFNHNETIKNTVPHFKDFFKQFLHTISLSQIINIKKECKLGKITGINGQYINELISLYESNFLKNDVSDEDVDNSSKKGFINSLYYNYYLPYKNKILGFFGIGLGIGSTYFLWKKYGQKSKNPEND